MKQKLSGKSCPRLGVFTAWFYGHYHVELFAGIEEAAKSLGAQAVYFSGRALSSPVPYENCYNIIYDTAANASLDGLIVMSLLANYCSDNTLTEFISRYKDIPLITINFRSPIGNAILSNNTPGLNALMKHLIEIHGYRKIAFIKGPERNPDAMERYDIYRSALKANGISLNPTLVADGYYTFRAGQDAVRVFLDERGLKPGPDIEAIVCANDAIALGAIDAIYSRGLRVPQDIAVTGFDNMNESIFPKFPLTSVRQHLREIGNRAVRDLLDYEPNREPLFLDTDLVIRDSCGCIKPEKRAGPAGGDHIEDNPASDMDSSAYKKDLEFIYYEITRIIDNLKDLQALAELSAWMPGNVACLGIDSAWLFLCSDPVSGKRSYTQLAGYDTRRPGAKQPKGKLAENAIFDDILPRESGRSLCILPLVFKENNYGILVMEVNLSTSLVYDTLSSHIASSIKNIFLGEQVAAINRELRQSNEQKTRFFINVAHETKTPLTLIQNYLALYMDRHESDENLLVIKENIDLLLSHMLNFLDAERLQKGETIYRHEALVDLSEAARSKCELFKPMASKKNIGITVNAPDRVAVKIDPAALDRIFNNLLDNAVKYIQDRGHIVIEVLRDNGSAVLRISDNGPGLSADASRHIFEPYYLLSKKRGGEQGIGVGLSIVKKIADGIGASIAAGKGEEGGACFTIIFSESRIDTEQVLQKIPYTMPPSTHGQEHIKERNISEDKRSLLIVDDNTRLLKLIQVSFSESYNVFLARNAVEAQAKLRIMPRPDVIVSDVMMDGADGFELLSALSAKEGYNDIPFIFLTALGGEKEKLKGLDLGAVDYIEKPFSIATLRAKIESIIGLRSRQERLERKRIRSRIDGLLSDSNEINEESANSGFEGMCKKYGIAGREKEIIGMLANRLANKEIASLLRLTQRAVEYHITKIFKKCGVNNKYDLLDKFGL